MRYWGGSLKYFPIVPGTRETISDSEYAEVGEWRILPAEPGDDSKG